MKSIKIMLLGIAILLTTIIIHLIIADGLYTDIIIGAIGGIIVLVGLFLQTEKKDD